MQNRITNIFKVSLIITILAFALTAATACDGLGEMFGQSTPTPEPTPAVGELGDATTYVPMGQVCTDENGIVYVSNGNGTCTVTEINLLDNIDKLTIPSYSPDGDQVTVLAHNLLQNATSLKEVVLPKGLYTISEYAFDGCTNLTTINIPDTVISIEKFAFSKCYAVTEINLGESLKTIGESAFQDCNSLTRASVPANVESLGIHCFAFCENLVEIAFNCKAQPNYTMILGCNKMHTLILNMTSPVLLDSFAYNTTIKKVVLGDNIVTVEESAFAGCHGIEEIIVGKNVENLDNNCFYECDELRKVVFEGNALISTGTGVFGYCINLEEIVFPEGLEAIGPKCFSGDYSLKKVHIPKAVTFVGEDAFIFCTALKEVTYSGTEQEWKNLSVRSGNDLLRSANIEYIVVE